MESRAPNRAAGWFRLTRRIKSELVAGWRKNTQRAGYRLCCEQKPAWNGVTLVLNSPSERPGTGRFSCSDSFNPGDATKVCGAMPIKGV